MSTGYTREQLHQLEILLEQNIPPEQSAEQLETAGVASDVAMAGTELGALIRMNFEHGVSHDFFLNCVVALELVVGLYGAAQEQSWWEVVDQPEAHESELDALKENDLDAALKVISLRTDSTPEGALISFGTGRTVSQFFMPKSIAHYLVAGLYGAGERAGWWSEDLLLIPSDGTKLQ